MSQTTATVALAHPADPEQILPDGFDDWCRLRQLGLGGSDAAAVCGLNPHKGPYAVWAEKTGRHTEVVDSEAVKWGTLLEPVILTEWADQSSMPVQTEPHLLRARDCPWMQASLDAVVGDDIVVEVKTAGLRMADQWDVEPPMPYWVQGLHYAAVSGRRRCIFVCLIGGQRLVTHDVIYAESSIDHLRRIEEQFWMHVVDDRPPDADMGDVRILGELRPESGSSVEVDDELALELVHSYHTAAEAERRARKTKDEAADRLKLLIGEHEQAITSTGRPVASWKAVERKGFTVAASTYRKLQVPKPASKEDQE